MTEHVDDRKRQVVPRWRPFQISATLGQLDASTNRRLAQPLEPAPGEIEGLQGDWARSQTPFHAANLVDAALILGRSEVAEEAAEWLVEHGGISDVSVRLAQQVLSPSAVVDPGDPQELTRENRHRRVASYRNRLRSFPRDSLLWVDLAREYAALGLNEPALRALRVAIDLAPNNRFVLRSASRFFLHTHDPEQAHRVLARASSTSRDPWLLAAEIVAASACGRQSRLIKTGARLLQSEGLHPRHLSELASAIGTLEHQAGQRRRVRKLFAQALRDPTENAVAQALWITRHMSGFELPEGLGSVPRAFEANAWEAARNSEFPSAVQLSWQWLRDEPFATRSALFGSYVSATAMGDYDEAIRLVEAAMTANPEDPRLLAQLLYCQACSGMVDVAEQNLRKLEKTVKGTESQRSDTEWEVVLNADRGLIAFRRGQIEEGRRWYGSAIELARTHQLTEYAASALINFSREEVLVGGHVDMSELKSVVGLFPPVTRQVVARCVERIETLTAAKSLRKF